MIALTAHRFHQRPSQLLSLSDDVIALDFDIAAAWKIQEWFDEREANRMAAMSGAPEIDVMRDLIPQ